MIIRKLTARPPAGDVPVIGVAASAGGLPALTDLLRSVPADFGAALLVAVHRSLGHPWFLVEVLQRETALAVRAAREGDVLEPGTVHVCPPGIHMTADRTVRLVAGPRLNFVRPSADLLFTSLASAYGRRAVGVVLSGMGTDGAIGSKAIVDAGGTVIAQDPATAVHPDMPAAAAALGPARFVLPPREIGPALQRLLGQRAADARRLAGRAARATRVLLADDHRIILDGLRALLSGEQGLAVLDPDAEDGHVAVRLSAELRPDVIVMDLSMPSMDGVAATREILAHNPSAKVVALSAHTDPRSVDRAIRAGASAVLSKQKAFAELARTIRSVASARI